MLRIKNKNKFTKSIFITFLIFIIFSPIFLLFQQNSTNLENIKSCETYASSLSINSEKVFRLSQLNREFIYSDKNLIIYPVLIEDIPNSINCLGKIWEVDTENNIIYIASHNLIFKFINF